MRSLPSRLLIGLVACAALGCSTGNNLTRLREENAQLAETVRQDRVRLANLEEQNRQLAERLADAEKSVALLHDTTKGDDIKRRKRVASGGVSGPDNRPNLKPNLSLPSLRFSLLP